MLFHATSMWLRKTTEKEKKYNLSCIVAFEIRQIHQTSDYPYSASSIGGALETPNNGFMKSFSNLEIPDISASTQMTVILGTAGILRQTLSL